MIAAEVAEDYTGPMRPFIIGSVAALFLTASCWLGTALAGPQSVGGRPKGKATATSSEASPKGRRYAALAYAAAGLITLIVVTIVAFPSRKEAWDQQLEKKPRRAGKRIRGE
jgi:hypothetical protein